jgi:hypothetical protein
MYTHVSKYKNNKIKKNLNNLAFVSVMSITFSLGLVTIKEAPVSLGAVKSKTRPPPESDKNWIVDSSVRQHCPVKPEATGQSPPMASRTSSLPCPKRGLSVAS